MSRIVLVVILGLIIQGCASKSYITKLDHPVVRAATYSDYFSSIDSNNGDKLSASAGDELFVMNRYLSSSYELVLYIPPTGIKFPRRATWSGSHNFNDGKSGDLIVYTTSEYYDGNIGVILDKDEQLATDRPLVQINGLKKGRRWKLNGSGKFFTIPKKNIDSWALRYGGNINNQYVFEIINKHESKSTEVLQAIYINEDRLRKGFVIRDVLIQGVDIDDYGILQYEILDVIGVTPNQRERTRKSSLTY